MNSLKVLDVTLRDGGCVNNFNFGEKYMCSILDALEQSNIDIIELGYIDQKFGSANGRTQYINEKVITDNFLKEKKNKVTYVAMMDYGKFNVDNLEPYEESKIDGIRMAFHKKNRFDMIDLAKKIIDKGYKFYIQPMTIMRYSDKELIEFIECVNKKLPTAEAFYIVDSFGEMRMNDMNRILNLVDHNLNSNMTLGFHSHNNLQLSYSNAVTLLEFPTNRDLILDCSLMGMGKGAGNLNTELFLEHLNLYYGKNYKIEPLLQIIDNVIEVIHDEFYWGYSIEYYLSSINHCTPSYAKHFYEKHMLPIGQVAKLLSMISEDKKISFDKEYAEKLYCEFNAEKSYDDEKTVLKLKKLFNGKKVLLIAPGKSIIKDKEYIKSVLNDSEILSISLNLVCDLKNDYIFTSRKDAYEKAKEQNRKIIVPSNIAEMKEKRDNENIIDYKKWIVYDGQTHDSSGIMLIKLLTACNVSELLLAGFDGFSSNINDNYYDITMRHPVTDEQAFIRNKFFTDFIKTISKDIKVKFLTESMYQ